MRPDALSALTDAVFDTIDIIEIVRAGLAVLKRNVAAVACLIANLPRARVGVFTAPAAISAVGST